jgi:glutamate synthase domain-containing protein 2
MIDIIWGRFTLFALITLASLATFGACFYNPINIIFFIPVFSLFLLGVYDYSQKKRAVLSNYPILGRFRFIFESIRPELRQYFWESDDDELPYSRNQRAMVYRRSKNIPGIRPFGSQEKMYHDDYVWLNHSVTPSHILSSNFRVTVGSGKNSYPMSVLNISGTSFGALSPNAITSLNLAAKKGNFAHNTGEGSFSKYHEAGGGDSIWQISTGYFGCRNKDGSFSSDIFEKKARSKQIKMIEIKLSQGAKPGHGGMLLGKKVNQEIAETRGVEEGEDCISPPKHSEFSSPKELLAFVRKLKKLSSGKPIGIKLCVGHPWEFISIVKAMLQHKIYLDFITIDGSEGGTGAAPAEFADHFGSPLKDAVVFASNTLEGAGLRDKVRLGASGKIVSAFDIAHICALGADWVNMARPFMFSIGCIQAKVCHSGECPSGVATMDKSRYRAIDVKDRSDRASNFHKNTLEILKEMLESVGVSHPSELNRRHIVRRLSESEIKLADQVYPKVNKGDLLDKKKIQKIADPRLKVYWDKVNSSSFSYVA